MVVARLNSKRLRVSGRPLGANQVTAYVLASAYNPAPHRESSSTGLTANPSRTAHCEPAGEPANADDQPFCITLLGVAASMIQIRYDRSGPPSVTLRAPSTRRSGTASYNVEAAQPSAALASDRRTVSRRHPFIGRLCCRRPSVNRPLRAELGGFRSRHERPSDMLLGLRLNRTTSVLVATPAVDGTYRHPR